MRVILHKEPTGYQLEYADLPAEAFVRLFLARESDEAEITLTTCEVRVTTSFGRERLRLDPQIEYRIKRYEVISGHGGESILLEAVNPMQLRPVAANIADRARRPTILL